MKRALDERRAMIEHRARKVAQTAVEHQQPWTKKLGRPPAHPATREAWQRQLDTIAAYRERWQINGSTVLGQANPVGLEQETQRRLAQQAVERALRIHRDVQRTVSADEQSMGIETGVEGVTLLPANARSASNSPVTETQRSTTPGDSRSTWPEASRASRSTRCTPGSSSNPARPLIDKYPRCMTSSVTTGHSDGRNPLP
jgi:hypothetical protein